MANHKRWECDACHDKFTSEELCVVDNDEYTVICKECKDKRFNSLEDRLRTLINALQGDKITLR